MQPNRSTNDTSATIRVIRNGNFCDCYRYSQNENSSDKHEYTLPRITFNRKHRANSIQWWRKHNLIGWRTIALCVTFQIYCCCWWWWNWTKACAINIIIGWGCACVSVCMKNKQTFPRDIFDYWIFGSIMCGFPPQLYLWFVAKKCNLRSSHFGQTIGNV